MNTVDLLLHPVRLRIVHALSGGRELTTTQLCTLMPDVARVTVYRQVAPLVDGGFLQVAGEQRVRGAVERRYRLRQDRPVIDADAVAAMTPEDHRRGFAAAMAVLIAEFNAYLDRDGADPVSDGVSYRQGTLWLSPANSPSSPARCSAFCRTRSPTCPLLTERPTCSARFSSPSRRHCRPNPGSSGHR